jgi:hypothetical protein
MAESKDPSEQNEPNEPEDPFAPGKTPPGWTQPGPGQPWEYQQPPQWSQPGGPIGPPQEQIPPEGVPPHWQQPYGQPPGQGQPPAGQWGPPPGQQWGYAGEKPNNHLVWAILSTILCCLPLGIASIVFANRVNSRWNAGDVAGAREASDKAMKFAIASAVLGLLGSILIISMGGLEA